MMRLLSLIMFLPLIAPAAGSVKEIESRAVELKAKGDAAGALAAYQEAAALEPKSAHFQDEIGFLLAVLNRQSEAVEHFKTAIDLDSRYAAAHYHLGVALFLAKDSAGSIRELQSAVDLEPQNAAYQ